MQSQTYVVFTTWPTADQARNAAAELVGLGLAACVSVLAPCVSCYQWKGALETVEEFPLMIKAPASVYPQLEGWLRARHPYDVPEIIALPVVAGLPDYLGWVARSIVPVVADPGAPV